MAFSSSPFYFRLVSILVSIFFLFCYCFALSSFQWFIPSSRERISYESWGHARRLIFLYTHEAVNIMWRRRCKRFGSEMGARERWDASPDSIFSSREETKFDSTGFPSQGLRWRLANVLVSHMISRTISSTRSGRKKKFVQRHKNLLLSVAGAFAWITHRCWFGWLDMLGCGIWGGGCETLICDGCIWCIVWWGWSIFFRLSIFPALIDCEEIFIQILTFFQFTNCRFHNFRKIATTCRCTSCTIHCTIWNSKLSRFFLFLSSTSSLSHKRVFSIDLTSNTRTALIGLKFNRSWHLSATPRDNGKQPRKMRFRNRKMKIWLTFYNIE